MAHKKQIIKSKRKILIFCALYVKIFEDTAFYAFAENFYG